MSASVEMARAVVAGLVRGGVAHACLCPGSRSSPLIAAFAPYENVGVELTVHHDERAAAFFALGVARATRRPVALVCTSGSAAAHFLPAVIEAHHSDIPLILLTADRPPELRDVGAPQATHQHRLFDGFTRWMVDTATSPPTPGRLAWLERTGFRAATDACSPRPGPVHLNLPFDEPLLPTIDVATPAPLAPGEPALRPSVAPPHALVERLSTALARSTAPLIVAGYADFTDSDRAAIAQLANTLNAPLIADPTANFGGGAAIGHYDIFLRDEAIARRLAPDAVIRFGAPPVSKALGRFLTAAAPSVHVVVDPHGEWQEPLGIPTTFVRASYQASALAIINDLKNIDLTQRRFHPGWIALESSVGQRLRAAAAEHVLPGHGEVARVMASVMRPGDHVHVASSLPIRDFDVFGRVEMKASLSCNRGVNGIDGTFSTALGVSFARRKAAGRTWALVGDVAALHDIGGLLAASQQPSNATLVVVNNDGGAIFGLLPVATHHSIFERFFTTPHGRTFEGAAALFGLRYHRVDDTARLGSVLEMSRDIEGVVLVEVVVDRQADVERYRKLMARLTSELDRVVMESA